MARVRAAYGSVTSFIYYLVNQVTGAGDVPVRSLPPAEPSTKPDVDVDVASGKEMTKALPAR